MSVIAGFPLSTLAFLWAGAFVGGVASGGAGFAFALAASSIWLHAFDPLLTTALTVTCGTLLQFVTIWPFRKEFDRGRLAPFILGAAIGVPLGVAVLSSVDVPKLKIAIGLGLVIYGTYAILAPTLPRVNGGGRKADAAVGFAGGVLGGIGGYSGVLPTIWSQLRGWPKSTARAVYQPYILFANFLSIALIGAVAFDSRGAWLFLLSLPALALGGWAGMAIFSRLDERLFRKFLAGMLLASGLMLLI
ncbi:sulfite exporter TauE/SafE family protein [Chelatococcus sambhunathii]|uniref:Probable membrane transporter protein n=1 Tax=Chelatococcus sambhunathii TaxID=363953 RepID=A0ABU1DBJ2_9HYPH|nr:sulfite exporter TauE/SafE family protein [Chelatococcus sambhunathii]MDR4305404.1 sulfite exporter TauE/SafE family protein [Chelatococcus sambhunathii]